MKPRLLLFDIDGTLVRTGGAGRSALGSAFEAVCGWANALDGVSLGGHTDLGIARQVYAAHRAEWDLQGVEAVFAEYLLRLPRAVEEAAGYEVMPKATAIVESLSARDGIYLGLGTGNLEAAAHIKLRRGGLSAPFQYGGFGSDAEARSELLLAGVRRGAELAGCLPEEADVVVIGDTLRDISAAREIGATVIAVATGSVSLEELGEARPDLAVASMEDPRVLPWLVQGSL